jgi:hypothetical protein
MQYAGIDVAYTSQQPPQSLMRFLRDIREEVVWSEG